MRETYSGVGVVLLVSSLATPAQAGLTHRYSFNDGTAKDSVGGADGVAVNGAGFAGGQLVFNPAVNNGITTSPAFGQYVDLPNGLAKTRSLTLEVWFTYRGGNAWQRILDFGNTNMGEILPSNKTDRVYSAVGYMILVPQSSAGRLLGQITIASSGSLSDTDYVTPNTSVSTGVEHHLVFTHDPDEHLERMYLDGVLAGTSVADVDPSTTQYTNFWLGRSNNSLDPFFNGTINELRIYDNAVSTADVTQSFARGPGSVPEPSVLGAGLVAAVVVVTGRRRRSNDAATA